MMNMTARRPPKSMLQTLPNPLSRALQQPTTPPPATQQVTTSPAMTGLQDLPQIQRRKKFLAEQLMQTSEPETPIEGIADLGSAAINGFFMNKANEEEQAVKGQASQALAQALQGGGDVSSLFSSGAFEGLDPGQQALASALLERQFAGKDKAQRFEVGGNLIDENGQVVYRGTPEAPDLPADVQEYEYAKQNGFNGSILDYRQAIAAAGRAPERGPEQPADVREYQFAVSQGFKGSYLDYLATKKGGGMSVTLPDGTVMQMGGSVKPPTESQAKAANQYTLLGGALDDLEEQISAGGVNPWASAAADTLSGIGPISNVIGQKFILSPEDKQMQASRAGALESLANSITGAAFTEEQKRNFISMLPAATDDAGTSVFKMKRMRNYLAQLQKNAGPALNNPMENGGSVEFVRGPDGKLVRKQ